MGKYVAPRAKDSDERETPDHIFDQLNQEFRFTLDAAACAENAKCQKFFSLDRDAFRKRWRGVVWLNPPYSQCGLWMKRAFEQSQKGACVVCLVPSATDTQWWHSYAARGEIRFVKGRIQFKGTKGNAPFPSAVVVFRPPLVWRV